MRTDRWSYAALLALLLIATTPVSWAAGTGAGARIQNEVRASFSVAGESQPSIRAGVSFWVDELLDVSLVSVDAAPVPVTSPQSGAVQQYNLTNTGNGPEAFRLAADGALPADDFDTAGVAIYLESNAQPGLQLGPGGDLLYVPGANDPVLAADASLTLYLGADVPAGLANDARSLARLRAVARTIVDNAGTDDPTQPAFPAVGDSYPGQGATATGGSGQVIAMVGTSYALADPLFQDEHDFQVTASGVALTKTTLSVQDPSGGSRVLPGSRVTYEILVDIEAGGAAAALQVNDVLPLELAYLPDSLAVVGLPAGEEDDDDFLPEATDRTGFDPAAGVLRVFFGDVAGPATLRIQFDALVR